LYTEFNAGKKPPNIIANHGFHPEVVEKEYQRFMKMNERDIDVLQNKIISDFIKQPSKNTKPLFEKYKTTGFLTHYELFELITLKLKDVIEEDRNFWDDKTAYLQEDGQDQM
jgi:hypothetical protein